MESLSEAIFAPVCARPSISQKSDTWYQIEGLTETHVQGITLFRNDGSLQKSVKVE